MDVSEIEKLKEQYGSPFYVFDFDIARKRVQEICSRLPKNAELCYAIKANPFLLPALKIVEFSLKSARQENFQYVKNMK